MAASTARILRGLAVLAIGAILTTWVIAMSFDPFWVTGSTVPSTITGPGLGRPIVLILSAILLIAAAWFSGRVRLVLLVSWFAFLTITTHRIAVFSSGKVEDIWLTQKVQSLPAITEGAEGRRCDIGTWVARCNDGASGRLTTVSPLPFETLYPGLWS
jgi:hypothetical protein